MDLLHRSELRILLPTRKSVIKFTRLRRTVVAMIGFTVLLIGLAMVVLPGPAVVVIPLGLAILATEFVWAKRLLEKARATITRKGTRKKERSNAADDPLEPETSIRQIDE
jgi:tellurite resistance protein TerC